MSTSPTIAFQRSGRVLLDTHNDPDGSVEDTLSAFAELTSAAGRLHTYQVSEMALWAAASSGRTASELIDFLECQALCPVPHDLSIRMHDFFERFGLLRLTGSPGALRITSDDSLVLRDVAARINCTVVDGSIAIDDHERGYLKARLAAKGYPVADQVKPQTPRIGAYCLGPKVALRDYQSQAVERFLESAPDGGLVLLPCGAGKTVVGVAIAARLSAWVLVITPNRTIGEQWADHFARFTTLDVEDISLFNDASGERPVTIVTYQALTRARDGLLAKLQDASSVPWGLIIYDEVHTLPADVFRQSAALQARRRLGLTATLVREDGRERDVFTLVGPPVWQSRWRELERQGWISPVECFEVRIRADRSERRDDSGLLRKIKTADRIIARHPDDRILIAAHRLREVQALAKRLDMPYVTGETPSAERSRLYSSFRIGHEPRLIVSNVANVGIDLPNANVLVQVSGTFGSRLEEAQRLGRLLRPGDDSRPARFYSLVLPDTREREFAERRQRFLVDQGYRYQVINVRG